MMSQGCTERHASEGEDGGVCVCVVTYVGCACQLTRSLPLGTRREEQHWKMEPRSFSLVYSCIFECETQNQQNYALLHHVKLNSFMEIDRNSGPSLIQFPHINLEQFRIHMKPNQTMEIDKLSLLGSIYSRGHFSSRVLNGMVRTDWQAPYAYQT